MTITDTRVKEIAEKVKHESISKYGYVMPLEIAQRIVHMVVEEVMPNNDMLGVDDNQFPEPVAHAKRLDPVESIEAAEKVNLPEQRRKVMTLLYSSDEALSDFDLFAAAKAAGWKDTYSGLGSRRKDLMRLGLVERWHEDGLSPSGNSCGRYVLSVLGRAWCDKNF